MTKRRKADPRGRGWDMTDALLTVHADPGVRSTDRRLFRAARRRLAKQSDTFLASQNGTDSATGGLA